MILSDSDLEGLTGYVRPSAQVRWLRRQGWRFAINALARPVVAVAEFERHLVAGATINKQEPDFGALNG